MNQFELFLIEKLCQLQKEAGGRMIEATKLLAALPTAPGVRKKLAEHYNGLIKTGNIQFFRGRIGLA